MVIKQLLSLLKLNTLLNVQNIKPSKLVVFFLMGIFKDAAEGMHRSNLERTASYAQAVFLQNLQSSN